MKRGDFAVIGTIVLITLVITAAQWALDHGVDENAAQVVIQVNGQHYKEISLDSPQRMVIEQDGKFNEVVIDHEGVYIESASCDNQECVHQGKATVDNIADRIMGGWIICLPNRVSIELRGEDDQ